MDKNSKIYVAGHRGLVGGAILKALELKGYKRLVTRTHKELDLTDTKATHDFFTKEQPEYVFLAAAKVGGIMANNTYRADFLYENLNIQNNVIHQSYLSGVKKLLFLGSTCIYPQQAPQPIREDYLLTSPLEYTNEPYAIAKIAGIKLCESYNIQYGTNFISAMPTNLYGPGDNFDLEKSHVIPALVRKIYLAKLLQEGKTEEVKQDLNFKTEAEVQAYLKQFGVTSSSVEIWGSGKPMREFLWSEDLADACLFLMENIDFSDMHDPNQKEVRNCHINVGSGKEVSIAQLAGIIKDIIGYQGSLVFNTEKPDGTMRKLTDVSRLRNLGWSHKVELKEGLSRLYSIYLNER